MCGRWLGCGGLLALVGSGCGASSVSVLFAERARGVAVRLFHASVGWVSVLCACTIFSFTLSPMHVVPAHSSSPRRAPRLSRRLILAWGAEGRASVIKVVQIYPSHWELDLR